MPFSISRFLCQHLNTGVMETKGLQEHLHPYTLRMRSPSTVKADRNTTTCAYCGRNFQDLNERCTHESDHLLEPEYRVWECNQCRRKFYSGISLEQHIHSKHAECRFCAGRKEVEGNSTISIQLRCGDCEREFADVLAYLQHDQAVHLSCQHCDQVGRRRNRAAFDQHCCGCDVTLYNDDQLDEHYWENPTHYHEHPNFIKKPMKSSLHLWKSSKSPTIMSSKTALPTWLETETVSNIRLSITPASPVEEISSGEVQRIQYLPSANTLLSNPRYGLLSRRQLSTSETFTPKQQSTLCCPECRITFQDTETLTRHQGFSFNITAKCDAVFGCPFSLLRHIEMGHCCQWNNFLSSSTSVESSKGKKWGSGCERSKDVEMQA